MWGIGCWKVLVQASKAAVASEESPIRTHAAEGTEPSRRGAPTPRTSSAWFFKVGVGIQTFDSKRFASQG